MPRLTPAAITALLALGSTVLSGCFLWTTRPEGNELAERSEAQEQRLEELESGTAAQREALSESVAEARAKVAEVEQLMEKATAVVTRNSADLGLEVQNLRQQISQLEGRIAELDNELQQTKALVQEQQAQKQAAGSSEVSLEPSEIPEDRTEHFAAAYRAFQSQEWAKSRALFRAYVQRHRDDDQADNAQYWIGVSYLRQRRPATALGELRTVLSDWPRGDAVDETLLDMAEAFFELNACSDARNALEALIRSHPRSPLISRARAKLQEIQSAPSGQCTS